jgi:nitroreductase
LVYRNRSFRRFVESAAVDRETLVELVDCARLSPSGRNLQPYKYLLSCDPEKNARIFPHLAWAAYLADWPGPAEGERPSAYIVALGDTQLTQNFGFDLGISLQSMLLAAAEKGLGGCLISSVQKEGLRQALNIPVRYDILVVMALGVPNEQVVVEPLAPGDGVRYWRDAQSVHHVPKRSLEELILE